MAARTSSTTRMYDATSPSDAITAPGGHAPAHGVARVRFVRKDGASRLAHLFQRTPMRVLLPRPAPGDLPLAVLVNVGGGLVAGDRAEVAVAVGEGAALMATSQAAEKVYRSTGATTTVENRLEVAAGGWLEWCPQETILFDRARLRRRLRLDLAGDARAMLGEILVLGRLAFGERAGQGLLCDRIEIVRDGALVWQDRLRLEGDYAPLRDDPAGLGGASALATFVYAGPDAPALLEPARELLAASPVSAGCTLVNGLLVARLLATDPLALRRAFALFWGRLRSRAAGLPPTLPRLWHV